MPLDEVSPLDCDGEGWTGGAKEGGGSLLVGRGAEIHGSRVGRGVEIHGSRIGQWETLS